jgi:tetratricopeptide (TPR) repeat protein
MRATLPLAAALLLAAPAVAQHDHPSTAGDSVPLYDNMGTLHHAVTTTSPLAQRYFDQGLRLAYAFNHEEAGRAFEQAIRLDPRCAMCHWGAALVLGPNINAPMAPEAEAQAARHTAHAVSLSATATPAEQGYIRAVAARYGTPPNADRRAALDSAYAAAMHAVAAANPGDPDAQALYAEAMMDLRPWDQWTPDGRPQPGTEEVVATLERAIATDPGHPGACHFYIHAVEASFQPELALPCAERLAALMPGAGHLVHMPAHVYLRVGRYADAVTANEHAAHADERFLADRQPQGGYPFYYAHNLHFLWAAAAMDGRGASAVQAARALASRVPVEVARQDGGAELQLAVPPLALARFGRWAEVLAEPAPPPELRLATAMWRHARGMALLRGGRMDDARRELDSVTAIAAALPETFMAGFHSGKRLAQVAQHALAGEVLAAGGDPEGGVRELRRAVELQDAMRYDEPEPFYYPVRHSLGAVLLAAGRAAEAEAVFQDDLRRHPENGWSLRGLADALRAQGRDAADAEARFARAWARADLPLAAARF